AEWSELSGSAQTRSVITRVQLDAAPADRVRPGDGPAAWRRLFPAPQPLHRPDRDLVGRLRGRADLALLAARQHRIDLPGHVPGRRADALPVADDSLGGDPERDGLGQLRRIPRGPHAARRVLRAAFVR